MHGIEGYYKKKKIFYSVRKFKFIVQNSLIQNSLLAIIHLSSLLITSEYDCLKFMTFINQMIIKNTLI